jgi:hypothetical protein
MFVLLLAAGLAAANRPPASVEGRMALLEARQMLEAQQVWQLRAELPPEVLRVIADLELHVQHDLEQEDRVRELGKTVDALQERLAAVELLLQDKAAIESTRIPVMQMQPLEVPARPAARKNPKRAAEKAPARRQRSRVAETP